MKDAFCLIDELEALMMPLNHDYRAVTGHDTIGPWANWPAIP